MFGDFVVESAYPLYVVPKSLAYNRQLILFRSRGLIFVDLLRPAG